MATGGSPDTDFVQWLTRKFQNCIRILKISDVSRESISQVLEDAIYLERQLIRVRGNLIPVQQTDDFIECVQELLVEAHGLLHENQISDDRGYQAPEVKAPGRGAAKILITREQLEYFISLNMTAPRIANALQVSERTIWRRLREYNLKLREFAEISDADLDAKVQDCIQLNKGLGAVAVRARLRAIDGTLVQRQRVRDSLERVDPVGVALRALKPKLERSTYAVAGPNSLWHMDGNHKLIRYRIVIHGAIDGATRLVVFAAASPNNLASTVFKHFIEAIIHYGLPSRIRVDQGVENADVCLFMELMRGLGRGSAIRGKSCHNQRIERLWVDIWNAVTNIYHKMFAFLESRQLLDPSNDVDIMALHHIFVPRINAELEVFKKQWNMHGLSTENGRSPEELFAVGLLQNRNTDLTAVKDVFDSNGIPNGVPNVPQDISDLSTLTSGRSRVSVPQLDSHLTVEQHEALNSIVNPLSESEDHGMSLYLQARQLVQEFLGAN